MKLRHLFPLLLLAAMPAGYSLAQSDSPQADASGDDLKIAALEALASAPAERAIPLAAKVLDGDFSDAVKIKALFVLSQVDEPEAQDRLLEFATGGSGRVRVEAIRMIGIGGNADALAGLSDLYDSGDRDLQNAILQAYLIADDRTAVYEIAAKATDEDDFEAAVRTLGAMGAHEELRQLRDRVDMSASLIQAYAISGDFESLREIARDASDPEQRDQAVNGLMIAGDEEGLIELYRASTTTADKRKVLQALSMMGSDRVFEIIDEALDGGR